MLQILKARGLRFVFVANLVSMIGSGMNTAAVIWYILQATHSEVALGTLVVINTIPAVLMLPFTGVFIDRQDRRRIVMMLDTGRGLIVLIIALLALAHRAQVWQLYAMNVVVSAGFWMFWPTINALLQELTPGAQFVQSNTLLLAGFQGGWLIAGALVGFIYNHVGLGGVLLIDFTSYVVSFLCYFAVRKGRHIVAAAGEALEHVRAMTAADRYFHEMREGLSYVRSDRRVILLGMSWALFIAAMMTSGVVTAPLSDRILHRGAVGYGWLNAGWASGAALGVLWTPLLIRAWGGRRSVAISMAVIGCALVFAPYSHYIALAVLLYAIMGSGRGTGGVAISSSMMEMVPPHFMGRVQNTFYFLGTLLQICSALLVGAVAHRIGLGLAFAIVGSMYLASSLAAVVPVHAPLPAMQAAPAEATVSK